MKTNKFILGLVLLIISLAFSSCGRDDDFILPKETTSGKNTLGFKVDGEVFLRRQNSLFEPYNLVARYAKPFGKYFFQITVVSENKNGDLGHLSFLVYEPISVGEKIKLERGWFMIDIPREYEMENDGEIEFTRFDTIARIASGRFSLSLKKIRADDIISITDGRFDVKLVDY